MKQAMLMGYVSALVMNIFGYWEQDPLSGWQTLLAMAMMTIIARLVELSFEEGEK